jgi:hypothetical protein
MVFTAFDPPPPMPMTLMGLDWEMGVVDSDMGQEWEKDVQIRVNGWRVQE